jgi:hypothetical protein
MFSDVNLESIGNFTYEIPFVVETIDTGEFHNDTFPTRMTVNAGYTGYYSIQVVVRIKNMITTDFVTVSLVKNNSTVLTYGSSAMIDNGSGDQAIPNVDLFYIDTASAGDYYTVTAETLTNDNLFGIFYFMAIYQGQP